MEKKKNSLISTTIAVTIINIIVYLSNEGYQNIFSMNSWIFYVSMIMGILSIILISKNAEKYKNIIMIFNILFILSGNIIALWNIVTIIKTKNLNGD